jgi:hypothetical protein
MNKYHSKKTIVDGITFDSLKESQRYLVLKMMEKSGVITDLELQPEFLLQERFVFNGKYIREIRYIADFSYTYKGKQIIEDIKSKATMTPIYLLKKKMLQFNYRDINFYEVLNPNDIGGMI